MGPIACAIQNPPRARTAMVMAALTLLACGGSAGDSDDESSYPNGGAEDDSGNADGGSEGSPSEPTPEPVISGFDLDVKEGGWWEFAFSYEWSGGYPEQSSSAVLVLLGRNVIVAGEDAYEVTFAEQYSSAAHFDWRYLSFTGNRIRGAVDNQFEPLFDAMTGRWPATNSGLFGSLLSGGFLTAEQEGDDWKAGPAPYNSTGCEVIPGYGSICTDSPGSYVGYDLFRPNIGPAGSYRQGCVQGGCETTEYVLVASSPNGEDPLPYWYSGIDPGVSDDCPRGDGWYCGGAGANGDEGTLYACANGEMTLEEVCEAACIEGPDNDIFTCGCPNGNDGTYCGGNGIPGDASTLYDCESGTLSVVEACLAGCYDKPEGDGTDSCAPVEQGSH